MEKCFFCKCIDSGDFELENKLAIARFDDFPVNKGHLEIIPKRHVKDFWETTEEERIAIFELLDEVKTLIDGRFSPDGYNIGMNLGENAGQSIMHLHIHLIPRYAGDVSNPLGGVRGIIPDRQYYSREIPHVRMYNKLVRDRIPDIIESKGEVPVIRILSDEDYKAELERKLNEEYREMLYSSGRDRLGELADMMEVIKHLAKAEGADLDEIIALSEEKCAERGAFAQKIFLEKVLEKGME